MCLLPAHGLCRWSSIVLLSIAGAGCASWTDRPDAELAEMVGQSGRRGSSGSKLLSLQEQSAAVTLTVESFTVPYVSVEPEEAGAGTPETDGSDEASDAEIESSVWQWIDEAAIAAATRRRYQANGLRIGRLVREDRFRRAIERRRGGREDVLDEFLREADVASPLAQSDRTLPMRFGRRYELPLHQPRSGEQVSLLRVDRRLVGRTLRNPQLLLGLSVHQGGSPHEVELEIRPEIQHGEAKRSFVSSDSGSAIRIDTRREAWKLETLDFAATLAVGDAVVISTTTPTIGLGDQMLTDNASDRGREQLFLVLQVTRIPSLADQL